MTPHKLLGQIQDPIIRQVLEDYRRELSDEIRNVLSGATFTVSSSGGGGGGVEEGQVVRIRFDQVGFGGRPGFNDAVRPLEP